MTTTPTTCPFKIGDRVRVNPEYAKRHRMKYVTGVVNSVYDWGDGRNFLLRVLRDVIKDYSWTRVEFERDVGYRRGIPWEPETDPGVLRDHTADLLIAAYQSGDKSALRPLIDRLIELL